MDDALDPKSDDSGFEDNVPAAPSSLPPVSNTPSAIADQLASLPPLQPLVGYGYSLLPDMIFGWQPKLVHGGPIPLLFNKAELPITRNTLTNEENFVVYHGFRPSNSFTMHKAFSAPDTYPIPNYPTLQVYEFMHRKDQTLAETRPFVGMNPQAREDDLEFDSMFEGGNLDKAVRVRDREYDLYMRTDANTRGHLQWFYFAVEWVGCGDVRFNLLNFTKSESLYTQGMLPIVFNEATPDLGWHPAGSHIRYKTSKLNPYTSRIFYSLSFTYTFKHPHKRVYFAYAIPYSYSRLRKLVVELGLNNEMIYKRESLCKSLSGVDVPLLTITNFSISAHTKQHVVVTGRVHPGETYGSFMMEGLLRFLLGDSTIAQMLRNRLVFHVVPMLNPDGVIVGNYRTGMAGCDLNRQFRRPNYILHPTVTALKRLISKIWKDGALLAFLDLHAHSKQKCVFMYGPHYPLHSEKYQKLRILPRLICKRAEVFRFRSCMFRNEKSKRKAARLVIWKEFKLANSFTVEASFYGYLTPDRETLPFTSDLLFSAGEGIAEGLYDYLLYLDREAVVKDLNRKKRKSHKQKNATEIPKTDNYPTFEKPSESIVLSTLEDLPPEEMKEESTIVEEACDSSDGDSSEDDLEPADQQQLHDKIVAVMEEFSELSNNPKTIRQAIKSGNRSKMKRITLEAEAKSQLEMYFSRAHQSVVRSRSNCKAVIPKVYDSGMIVETRREIRSVSLKGKDGIARHLTQKDLGKRTAARSRLLVETGAGKLPTTSERASTRLSSWLGRHMPQSVARESISSSDDQSPEPRLFPLNPSLRPLRFPSVLSKSPPKQRLSRQFSTDISSSEK